MNKPIKSLTGATVGAAMNTLKHILLLGSLLMSMVGSAGAGNTVTDLAGRSVVVPDTVTRAATLGAVAPLNSFLFMIGHGKAIANGLPLFFQNPYWEMQRRLGPGLVKLPVISGSDGQPNMEALLAMAPQVVFTSARPVAQSLESAGIPALVFEWNDFGNLMQSAEVLGKVFHEETRAGQFRDYCEKNAKRVETRLAKTKETRPRVAFLRMKTFSQPARIADWTLKTGGGDNVGIYGVQMGGQPAMTTEMLLRADPEVLIVWSRDEREALLADPRFAGMSAVRKHQVHAVPVGATPWLAPGVEQCLGVLWVAQRLYPARFGDLDLTAETREFYRQFYGLTIDATEAKAILNGMD